MQDKHSNIAEFKSLSTSDFVTISDEQKLLYLDMLTSKDADNEQYRKNFSGTYNNLKACLYSIKVPNHFIIKEKAKVNHFINALIGLGMDNKITNADKRTSKEKMQDINDFVNLFCQIYQTPVPKIKFQNPNSSDDYIASVSKDGKTIKLPQNFLDKPMLWHDYEIIFHEMIHIYQHSLYQKNPDTYKIFNPAYNRLKFGIYMAYNNDKRKIEEIYLLLPKERHAYLMDSEFANLYNERILNNKFRKRPVKADFAALSLIKQEKHYT